MLDETFEILPHHEAFYISSLLFCSASALKSIALVTRALQDYRDDWSNFPAESSLDELQNIALQGAGISRFFWPSCKCYRSRGEYLRKAFGIMKANALSSRDLRNHMEHFDERLDDYLKGAVIGTVVTNYFGPKPPPGQSPFHIFRAFFNNTEEFVILGKVFAFKPLVDELSRIHTRLIQCVSQGWRLPKPPGASEPPSAEAT